MYPAALEQLGLGPTIQALCRRIETDRAGVRVDLEVLIDDAVIPCALRIVVYRTTESAILIAVEQAESSTVRVQLGVHDGVLSSVVDGNGEGLMAAAADTINGGVSPLSELRERTAISGGNLAVLRSPRGGLQVRATWPLPLGS